MQFQDRDVKIKVHARTNVKIVSISNIDINTMFGI